MGESVNEINLLLKGTSKAQTDKEMLPSTIYSLPKIAHNILKRNFLEPSQVLHHQNKFIAK